MNRFERRKRAIEQAIREQIDLYKGIYKKADDEDRDPTDDERLEIETHLKAIETLKTEKDEVEENIKTLDGVKKISDDLGPAVPHITVGDEPQDRFMRMANASVFPQAQKSMGERFIESEPYKKSIQAYREAGGRFQEGFSSGPVEMKGTLLEGTGAPGSGSGGGLIPVPQVVPGVVQTLFQRLTVSDLLLSGQTTQNTIRYVVEGTATSGAAGVAEGGSKPESTLGLGTKDESVKKIATFLPISDEMLEDAPAVQAYINGRLTLFVQIEEERQLLRGSSGGTEVQGLLTSRNVPTRGTANWTAGDAVSDKLFKAMNYIRTNGLVEPEWVIIHPDDYQAARLLKDGAGGTVGQYYGGGPFLGAYGNGGQVNASSQVTGAQDQVWGKPAYVTSAIGSGTALVGTRSNAQIWRKGGLSVEASNSHSNYFQLNLIALRAEERLGLTVYRPTAYTEVHFATA